MAARDWPGVPARLHAAAAASSDVTARLICLDECSQTELEFPGNFLPGPHCMMGEEEEESRMIRLSFSPRGQARDWLL